MRAGAKPVLLSAGNKVELSCCAAEAFAYGAKALVARRRSGDLGSPRSDAEFLRAWIEPPLPVQANIGFIDDGSHEAGEVMIFYPTQTAFRIVYAPDPHRISKVKLGHAGYPARNAATRASLRLWIRRKLSTKSVLPDQWPRCWVSRAGHLATGLHARPALVELRRQDGRRVLRCGLPLRVSTRSRSVTARRRWGGCRFGSEQRRDGVQ